MTVINPQIRRHLAAAMIVASGLCIAGAGRQAAAAQPA